MKILFVITRGDSIGGAQVHVRDLATRLNQDGHEVLVIVGATGPLTDALQALGIRMVVCDGLQKELHPLRDIRACMALRRIIKGFNPDFVSTHSSKAGTIGRIASWLTRTPCLFTAHGWAFTGGVPEPRRTIYRWMERLTAPLASRIICVSAHDRLLALGAGIQPNKLVTIHNGMPDIPAELRGRPDAPGPVRIVMVARFDAQKDHPTILRAMAGIPAAELHLVGDGPSMSEMRALATELGLGERVQFLGQRRDVAHVLSTAHIFALASHWEGFPRSTLEAMRAGLPAVVSDVGGAKEAIDEGRSGFSVSAGDVAALRDRLQALVTDVALRKSMGEEGRRIYEGDFTFERMYQQTTSVYREIVSCPAPEQREPAAAT